MNQPAAWEASCGKKMKRLIRWLYWRTHEEYVGGTPWRSSYPDVGKFYHYDGHLYLLTRIKSDPRPYYVVYAIDYGPLNVPALLEAKGKEYLAKLPSHIRRAFELAGRTYEIHTGRKRNRQAAISLAGAGRGWNRGCCEGGIVLRSRPDKGGQA